MRNCFSALNREFDKRNYLHVHYALKNMIPSAKSFGSNHIKNSFLFLTKITTADVFLGVTKLSPFHTTSLVFSLYPLITTRCKTHDLKVDTQAITYLFVFTMFEVHTFLYTFTSHLRETKIIREDIIFIGPPVSA